MGGEAFPGLFDKPGVSIVVILYLVATGIGLSFWGLALAKVNVKTGSLVAVVAAIIAPLLLLASNLSSVNTTMRWFFFAFYLTALLIQTGLIPTFMALTNREASTENAIQLASAFVISTAIGSIIGPLLGGFIVSEFSFSGLCIGSCVLAIMALTSLFLDDRGKHGANWGSVGNR